MNKKDARLKVLPKNDNGEGKIDWSNISEIVE